MTVLIVFIVTFAFFIQGIMGFGGGFVSIPLLLLLMPASDGITLVMFFQLMTGLLLFRVYKDVERESLIRFLPGVVLGMLVGVSALSTLNDDVVRVILALFIIWYVTQNYTNAQYLSLLIKKTAAPVIGFMAGGVAGLTGMGGPIYIAYFKEHLPDKTIFRSTILAAFFATNMMRLPMSFSLGMVSDEMIKLFLISAPGVVIVLWLGQKVSEKIPQALFFKATNILLLFAAASLVFKVVT